MEPTCGFVSTGFYRKYYPVAGYTMQAPLAVPLHDHDFCC